MATEQQSPRRARSVRFYAIYFVCLLLFSSIVAEVVARLTRHHPWIVKPTNIKVEPGGRLFQTNPTLGYTHLP